MECSRISITIVRSSICICITVQFLKSILSLSLISTIGEIGIGLHMTWPEPKTQLNDDDFRASERYTQFQMGWFLNPVINGDYPEVMKTRIAQNSHARGLTESRLPIFNSSEIDNINGKSSKTTQGFLFVLENVYLIYLVDCTQMFYCNKSCTIFPFLVFCYECNSDKYGYCFTI